MAEGFFSRNFVWYCDRASITAGKVSVLACLEVVFSLAAYWWIAWYFKTYAHLLVSIIVAPLVLLRSDKSVKLGVLMFRRYWGGVNYRTDLFVVHPQSRYEFALEFSIVTALGLLSFGASWFTAGLAIPGYEGWALLWQSAMIGILAVGTPIAAAAAVLQPGLISKGVAVVMAVAGLAAGAGMVAVAITGVVAGALLGVGIGLALGVLVRAVVVRLFASLYYLADGVKALPGNWWQTLFLTDLALAPELIPGLDKKRFDLSLVWLTRVLAFSIRFGRAGRAFFIAPMILVIVLPSLLYRYSIKSTCWLYLPLIYLVHVPGKLREPSGRLVFLRSAPVTRLAWAQFGLASVTLAVALFAMVNPTALKDLLAAAGIGQVPVSVFSLILVLDFSHLYPWQYLSLSSAILTAILFFWLDHLRKEVEAGGRADMFGWKIGSALFVHRLRNLLVILWLLVAFYYWIRYMYFACGYLPEWMNRMLEWVVGSAACR